MSEIPPNVQTPSTDEIVEMASRHYLNISEEEIEDYTDLIHQSLSNYELLDTLSPAPPPREEADRNAGYRPNAEEDPYNAFVTKCKVSSKGEGKLSEYRIVAKDVISIAGIEMTCGSKVLEGYVPSSDATIIRRILREGGTIIGKANTEDMACSGSGELSATGPVLNPRDTDYLAGGSSSGSAAAVAAGEADIGLGTDMAGSVRIPAAWCGLVGLKPTHGLVPFTGIIGLGPTLDHAGPITTSVPDCARVMDVIAGEDPQDPRQGAVDAGDFESELQSDVGDISIGVLEEGFQSDKLDESVESAVHDALDKFAGHGIATKRVSVPEHTKAMTVWIGVATEAHTALTRAEGVGHYHDGWYDTQFAEIFGKARRAQADDFPPTLKVRLILGEYLMEQYQGRYHAKAQNLRESIGEAYDTVLSEFDVLAMPTTPFLPHEVTETASRSEVIRRGRNMVENTAPFDLTGHPAISVTCGHSDGLPIGLMFVGRRFEDPSLLQVANQFEKNVAW